MKVLLNYNNNKNVIFCQTIRIELPKSWLKYPTNRLLEQFVQSYNEVFTNQLSLDNVHLAKNVPNVENNSSQYVPIPSDEPISIQIVDKSEIFVRHGPSSLSKPIDSLVDALDIIENTSFCTKHVDNRENKKDSRTDVDCCSDDELASFITLQSNDDINESFDKNDNNVEFESHGMKEEKSQKQLAKVSIGHRIKKTVGGIIQVDKGRKEPNTNNKGGRISKQENANSARVSTTCDMRDDDTQRNNGSCDDRSKSSAFDVKKLVTSKSGLSKRSKINCIPAELDKIDALICNGMKQTENIELDISNSSSAVDRTTKTAVDEKHLKVRNDMNDEALIRFRSILDWLGVPPELYEHVVIQLRRELSKLSSKNLDDNMDAKNELVKKTLGTLLEASYMNEINSSKKSQKEQFGPDSFDENQQSPDEKLVYYEDSDGNSSFQGVVVTSNCSSASSSNRNKLKFYA
jgi:hypothetical protein